MKKNGDQAYSLFSRHDGVQKAPYAAAGAGDHMVSCGLVRRFYPLHNWSSGPVPMEDSWLMFCKRMKGEMENSGPYSNGEVRLHDLLLVLPVLPRH